MLNRQLDVQGETLKSVVKFMGWIIGISGALNVNGKKLAQDLENQINRSNLKFASTILFPKSKKVINLKNQNEQQIS